MNTVMFPGAMATVPMPAAVSSSPALIPAASLIPCQVTPLPNPWLGDDRSDGKTLTTAVPERGSSPLIANLQFPTVRDQLRADIPESTNPQAR